MIGTFTTPGIFSEQMNADPSNDRTRRRAEKLQREAFNCLSLAIHETSPDFTAALIEEAAMLSKRASELSASLTNVSGAQGAARRRSMLLVRHPVDIGNPDSGQDEDAVDDRLPHDPFAGRH